MSRRSTASVTPGIVLIGRFFALRRVTALEWKPLEQLSPVALLGGGELMVSHTPNIGTWAYTDLATQRAYSRQLAISSPLLDCSGCIYAR